MDWKLHWLEAEGELQPWRDRVEDGVAIAREAIERLLTPKPLDIIVQRLAGGVIPELGLGGHAYRRRCFGLTLDPDNPNFERSLATGAIERIVVHEAHHCMRMHCHRGYGMTLGEALVSEGMAGRFTQAALHHDPEPWEVAVPRSILRAHMPDAAALASDRYDHNGWFFGTRDGRIPRWLGYTLGYELVGAWADATSPTGATWVETPAEEVLDVAIPLLSP